MLLRAISTTLSDLTMLVLSLSQDLLRYVDEGKSPQLFLKECFDKVLLFTRLLVAVCVLMHSIARCCWCITTRHQPPATAICTLTTTTTSATTHISP